MPKPNQIHVQFYTTSLGEFILGSFQEQLCILDFRHRKMRNAVDNRVKKGLGAKFVEQDDHTLQAARAQIDEYLSKRRQEFDIPLRMVGTDFQKSVWNALMRVPYGTTATYLQLANTIGNTNAVRAVAAANGANAISLVIPCHRIIGSNGDLVGYGGGLRAKRRLLALEHSVGSHVYSHWIHRLG